MIIAVSMALAVTVWIALDNPAAAAFGVGVYLVSGLVAYVANAQQVSAPKPDPGPALPLSASRAAPMEAHPPDPNSGERVIILLSNAEPPAYQGPAGWAFRLDHAAPNHDERSLASRLTFPIVLSRIRAAYAAMPNGHPDAEGLTALAQTLAQSLPTKDRVVVAYLQGEPHLRQALRDIRRNAPAAVTIVHLAKPDQSADECVRELLTISRIRETGVRVTIQSLETPSRPSTLDPASRLDLLLNGQPLPPSAQTPSPTQIESLLQLLTP